MNKKRNTKIWIILFLCLIVVAPLVWVLMIRFEGEKPSIVIELSSTFVGTSQEMALSVSDAKSGVRKIRISLSQGGKEVTLHEANFPSVGFLGKGAVNQKQIHITVEPATIGFGDGETILALAAWDYSWRDWLHGNHTYVEKNLTIDTRSPVIEVFSRAHNVNQGGAGIVIYRISEPCPKSGVYVGDRFFPGYSGIVKDHNVHVAFFALSAEQDPQTAIFIKADDRAGNGTSSGIHHYFRSKSFKRDTINISDTFLNWKMPEFNAELSNLENATMIEKFLFINRDLRKANYEKIRLLSAKTEAVLRWEGSFLRMPKSAPQAGFADQRTYTYNGQTIDHQLHLGVDLASVEHSPVPAANNGVVVFAEPLGIYGRTVFLDHGFGLFSMYSHLNQISVSVGQTLAKGDILGSTGTTGLAGGDHLHFAILVHDTFVNPIEWWDDAWIKNNISTKIDGVKSESEKG